MLHYGFEKSKWGGVLSAETFQSIASVRQEDCLSLGLLWEEKSIRSRCIWCFEFLTLTEANSLSGQAWRKCQSRAGKKIIVLKLFFFFVIDMSSTKELVHTVHILKLSPAKKQTYCFTRELQKKFMGSSSHTCSQRERT